MGSYFFETITAMSALGGGTDTLRFREDESPAHNQPRPRVNEPLKAAKFKLRKSIKL